MDVLSIETTKQDFLILVYLLSLLFIFQAAAYIAEMCPPQIRGAVVSAKETVIVGGIVGGYAIGNSIAQADNNGHWTTLYAMSGLSALPMLVLTYFIPRSKRWLLMKGYRQEAYESMAFVYKGDIQEEFDHLEAKIETNPQHSFYEDDDATPSLCDPKYRSAMIASMGLIIFQQFSGQPSVLSYATVLFQAAGWSGNASVVSSVLMMCMSISTVLLVDRVGRKRLLMVCCIIMMTALSALSTSFWGWNGTAELGTAQKCIILVAMFVYIGGYQVGFGPITWCIVSEVFPLEIRGKAIALGVELNYGLNFLVQFTFPILKEKLGWGPTFCFFGVILAFCLFFVKTCVPETTGLTLEEIQLKLSMRETFPSERSSLLPDFMGGGLHNLEEMENQMIRTHSEIALAEKENPNKPK
jgi:sugar porter (SP) family MFS transporter